MAKEIDCIRENEEITFDHTADMTVDSVTTIGIIPPGYRVDGHSMRTDDRGNVVIKLDVTFMENVAAKGKRLGRK